MRLVLFYLLLFLIQGFLAALIAPVPVPDLFLLGVLTLLWRIAPWQLVLIAYGVGLVQDMAGHGTMGVHALGLAGGVLLASFVRAQLSQTDLLERFLVILAALVGKWAVLAALMLWLGYSTVPLVVITRVAPIEVVLTLAVGIWLLPYAHLLMERTTFLRKELL